MVGENKNTPMVSFYAAAIGVMFLLFTASGASGSLLDEAESGTLDRVLSLMSSVGGSMFPCYYMSEAMQRAGLFTINAWAIDGFTKVFWRDEPISHLWPQVLEPLGIGVVFWAVARRLARRWEYS